VPVEVASGRGTDPLGLRSPGSSSVSSPAGGDGDTDEFGVLVADFDATRPVEGVKSMRCTQMFFVARGMALSAQLLGGVAQPVSPVVPAATRSVLATVRHVGLRWTLITSAWRSSDDSAPQAGVRSASREEQPDDPDSDRDEQHRGLGLREGSAFTLDERRAVER
jgi:hypothetical protein